MFVLRSILRRAYLLSLPATVIVALLFGASALLSPYEPSDVQGAFAAVLAGVGAIGAGIFLVRDRTRADARMLAVFAGASAVALWPFLEYVYGRFPAGGFMLRAFELGSVGAFFICSSTFFAAYVFARRFGTFTLVEIVSLLGSVGAILFLFGMFSPAHALVGMFGDSFSAQLFFATSLLCWLALAPLSYRHISQGYASGISMLALAAALAFSHSEALILSTAFAASALGYFEIRDKRRPTLALIVALGLVLIAILDLPGLLPPDFGLSHSPGTRATYEMSAFISAKYSTPYTPPRPLLIGNGPGSFDSAWALIPVSLSFPASSSTPPFVLPPDSLSLALIEFGVPFFLFLLFFVVYAIGIAGERDEHRDSTTRINTFPALALAFLWCALYVPSISYLAVVSGLLGGALGEHDRHGVPQAARSNAAYRMLALFLAAALVVFGAYLAYRGSIRALALVPYERGMEEMQHTTPDFFAAEDDFRKSISYEQTFFNEFALAEADDAEIQVLAPQAARGIISSHDSLRLAALSVEVLTAAQIASGDNVFAPYLLLRARAEVDAGVLSHDAHQLASALKDLSVVESKAPRDPTAYLLEARIESALGNEDAARRALRTALGLMGAVIY